ncbi:MAG: response regulator transcription factor [Anaerolineae bacterium]|nr:response regulator transcription factor [Anaerolineae bacterium]
MYEILIVDDDVQMQVMVEQVLQREGYSVLRASTASQALKLLESTTPDLFIVDVVMPDVDGLTLCRKLRQKEETSRLPIIFLTGSVSTLGVVDALESGADDYIRKPFAPRELVARVRSLIRRYAQYVERDAPTIRLHRVDCRVTLGNRTVVLTRVEFDLLKYLCSAPFQMHTAETLLTTVWRYPSGIGDAALVRNHIRNIRRKIEVDPERPVILQSRHGRGYVIKARPEIEMESAFQLR